MRGIYLHTRSLSMLTGAMAESAFFCAGWHRAVTGIVSHSRKDGVGIMFWRPQPELYDAVIASVSGNRPIAHQDGAASEAVI
ncbi:MAG: hypothetical protein ABW201_09320 [Candidatus Thiodiazotropha sp.]